MGKEVVLISSSSMASINLDDDPINDIEDGTLGSSTEAALLIGVAPVKMRFFLMVPKFILRIQHAYLAH